MKQLVVVENLENKRNEENKSPCIPLIFDVYLLLFFV